MAPWNPVLQPENNRMKPRVDLEEGAVTGQKATRAWIASITTLTKTFSWKATLRCASRLSHSRLNPFTKQFDFVFRPSPIARHRAILKPLENF
jgi:hypothetical protein